MGMTNMKKRRFTEEPIAGFNCATTDADDPFGNLPAAFTNWQFGDADSMSARASRSPHQTTEMDCYRFPQAKIIGQPIAVDGSPDTTS